MKLIPVLDLMAGNVVHAVRGQRRQYLPVKSVLCESAIPGDIVQAFLELHPFEIIYIADLDAIGGTGSHEDTLVGLMEQHGSTTFWIDRGISSPGEMQRLHRPGQRHVIGSETGIGPDTLFAMRLGQPDMVLSLDFTGRSLAGNGDEALLSRTDSWPDTLVLMELDRVGSARGPDMEKLALFRELAGSRSLFAAGGIRNPADLEYLAAAGIDGALLASALHDGTIGQHELLQLADKKMPRKAGHHPSNG